MKQKKPHEQRNIRGETNTNEKKILLNFIIKKIVLFRFQQQRKRGLQLQKYYPNTVSISLRQVNLCERLLPGHWKSESEIFDAADDIDIVSHFLNIIARLASLCVHN